MVQIKLSSSLLPPLKEGERVVELDGKTMYFLCIFLEEGCNAVLLTDAYFLMHFF